MGKRYIVTLLMLLPITLLAQSKAAKINHIRKVYQSINQDTTLKKIILDSEQLAKFDNNLPAYDNGEDVTGYFKKGNLVKIVNGVGLSFGMKTLEYYLEAGKVIFVYERQDNYPYITKMQKLDYNKLTTVFEGRYYLANGKLLKLTETGTLTGDKNEAISFMRADARRYAKILQKVNNG